MNFFDGNRSTDIKGCLTKRPEIGGVTPDKVCEATEKSKYQKNNCCPGKLSPLFRIILTPTRKTKKSSHETAKDATLLRQMSSSATADSDQDSLYSGDDGDNNYGSNPLKN